MSIMFILLIIIIIILKIDQNEREKSSEKEFKIQSFSYTHSTTIFFNLTKNIHIDKKKNLHQILTNIQIIYTECMPASVLVSVLKMENTSHKLMNTMFLHVPGCLEGLVLI